MSTNIDLVPTRPQLGYVRPGATVNRPLVNAEQD